MWVHREPERKIIFHLLRNKSIRKQFPFQRKMSQTYISTEINGNKIYMKIKRYIETY